ncbi:MAG: GNAT family N-acetyltransferase [Pirellulaceae bacterium]
MKIHIIPLVRDERALSGLEQGLGALLPALRRSFPKLVLEIIPGLKEEEVIARVESGARSQIRHVVISDVIVQPSFDISESYEPVLWVKELIADSAHAVSIALVNDVEKILDIDRVLRVPFTEAAIKYALEKAIFKLVYLSPPQEKLEIHPQRVKLKMLTNLQELNLYFRLRHEVYSVMGYLESPVERCESGLEIDNSDLRALHFGVFVESKQALSLAGTARIITNRPATSYLLTNLELLVKHDPVITNRIHSALALQLPVFESQHASNSVLTEILKEDVVCGELSRVIVSSRFRGAGLSERLVQFAIQAAQDRGVERLFLECLPIHTRFYEGKFGFRVVPEMVGNVVGVQRTMGVMERTLNTASVSIR